MDMGRASVHRRAPAALRHLAMRLTPTTIKVAPARKLMVEG